VLLAEKCRNRTRDEGKGLWDGLRWGDEVIDRRKRAEMGVIWVSIDEKVRKNRVETACE
jgi:hypothetical protein